MTHQYKIVVAQPIDSDIIDSLSENGPVFMNPGPEPIQRDALVEMCESAHAIMAFMTERIDREFLLACPNLKIVAGALKGFDNVDITAFKERSVKFTYIPDLLTQPTAELAIGLMIAVARNMLPGDARIRSGTFSGWRPTLYGDSINGSTVGILGAGAVGQAIMKMLSGFDCQQQYFDPSPLDSAHEATLSANSVSFDTLVSTSDFLVLATPLTDQTIQLINADVLARMKPGSYLINPARGSVVVEQAVADALQSGHLAGYAADVFELEDRSRPDAPATVPDSLIQSDRTVFSPHIGSAVTRVRREIALAAAHEISVALASE